MWKASIACTHLFALHLPLAIILGIKSLKPPATGMRFTSYVVSHAGMQLAMHVEGLDRMHLFVSHRAIHCLVRASSLVTMRHL
jgi:hypothetical protein